MKTTIISSVLFAIVIFLHMPTIFAEHDSGTLEVTIRFSNGDRAGPYGTKILIYEEPSDNLHAVLEPNTTYPYFVIELPMEQKYRIEAYSNEMLIDYKYVFLKNERQIVELFQPNPSGLKFSFYYDDGHSPIRDGDFALITQNDTTIFSDVTDNRGESQRVWTTPTLDNDEYYVGFISLGNSLNYTSDQIKLLSGQIRDIKVITPWPTSVDLLSVSILKNNGDNIKHDYTVSLKNMKNYTVGESSFDWKQRAFFNNLNLGNYYLQIQENKTTIFQQLILLDGDNLHIKIPSGDIKKNLQLTTADELIPNDICDCIEFYSKESVPSWFIPTLQLWFDKKITDSLLLSSIHFVVYDSNHTVVPNSSTLFPTWIDKCMAWWYDGKITDTEFVHNLKYLVSKNII